MAQIRRVCCKAATLTVWPSLRICRICNHPVEFRLSARFQVLQFSAGARLGAFGSLLGDKAAEAAGSLSSAVNLSDYLQQARRSPACSHVLWLLSVNLRDESRRPQIFPFSFSCSCCFLLEKAFRHTSCRCRNCISPH